MMSTTNSVIHTGVHSTVLNFVLNNNSVVIYNKSLHLLMIVYGVVDRVQFGVVGPHDSNI